MRAKHSLSVIVIAKDEADRIRGCLDSVKDLADEMIVLDANSTDGTVEICREYTDQVFVTEDWPGDGIQKQRALEKATKEWVLRIDADERVSPDLRTEIEAILAQETIEEAAFRISWATYFFGKYLTRGECGASHWNLFRREGAAFESVVVHSRLLAAPGPRRTLKGRLLHDANRSMRHFLERLVDYACLAASDRAARGKTSSLPVAFVRSWWRFFTAYVLKRGFLDGWRGLLVATLYSNYVFNKYAALWSEAHSALPARDESHAKQRIQEEVWIRPAAKGEFGTGVKVPETTFTR